MQQKLVCHVPGLQLDECIEFATRVTLTALIIVLVILVVIAIVARD